MTQNTSKGPCYQCGALYTVNIHERQVSSGMWFVVMTKDGRTVAHGKGA